ncbi:MAG: hypothetical protein VX583_01105 [Bdellovibrionota bacterium]|nr:hypothetical protein [Pseudobdellovibrionaceae bacterium]
MAEEKTKTEEAAVEKQLQKQLPEIQCKTQSSNEDRLLSFAYRNPQEPAELKVNQLTVGDEFILSCQGDSFDLIPDKFKIIWSKEVPDNVKSYSLKILEVEKNTASEIAFRAKSFVAGKQKLNFQIDTGTEVYQVRALEINVASLLEFYPKGYNDPKEAELVEKAEEGLQKFMQNQQPKAFPAIGGVEVSYPNYLWYFLAFALVLAALAGVFSYRKQKKKKQEEKRWQESRSPIGSHKDFHKSIRQQERAWYTGELEAQLLMDDLYKSLRMFFFREYKLNNQVKSHKHILDFFKKSKTTKESRLRRLQILLDELSNSSEMNGLEKDDVRDYLKRSRELVDHLYIRGGL